MGLELQVKVCVFVCETCICHKVKESEIRAEVTKKCGPRLYSIYIRPLLIEVEGVFVAVASLDAWGVGSEVFAMASILSCLLPCLV